MVPEIIRLIIKLMNTKSFYWVFVMVLVGVFGFAYVSSASNSWGGYHWARTANPFTLRIVDNVTDAWDSYLRDTSASWSTSSVLDTIVTSVKKNSRRCEPAYGRVKVCNARYGENGWLGLAQIWVIDGVHIVQGLAQLNDTYFNSPAYNSPAWRNMVMCQEVAHTFGLDHQDESFFNANLGTCMDYTDDPARDDGVGDNQYPNIHDFEELETIYSHLDNTNTVSATESEKGRRRNVDFGEARDWGKGIEKDDQGRNSVFAKDLGTRTKVVTHVFWTE
jgi:hypothetical protein